MKKTIIALILVTVTLFALAAPAWAEGETYTIEKWGVTVTLPQGYDVIDESTPEDHPQFKSYDMTKDEYLDMLKWTDICFEMVSEDCMSEIYMQVWREAKLDFSQLTDQEILEFATSTYNSYNDYRVYQSPTAKFICMIWGEEEWTGVDYFTAYQGRMIWITLDCYEQGEDLEKAQKVVTDFIDSMSFSELEAPVYYMGGRYDICDGMLAINVPDNYHVMHEGIPEDAETDYLWGFSVDEMLDNMREMDVVLMGMSEEEECSFTVICTENAEYDYSSMTGIEMDIAKSAIKVRLEQQGYDVKELKECSVNGYKGLYVLYYDQEWESDFATCFTTVNGCYVTLNVTPDGNEITPEHEGLFSELFDEFTLDPQDGSDWLLPTVSNIWQVLMAVIGGAFFIGVAVIVIVIVVVIKARKKKQPAAVKFCPVCGARLDAESRFCGSCGKEV